MKILQINASYKPAFIYGGPTMSVSKLSEILVKNEMAVEVLTTTANGEDEVGVIPGRKVVVDGVPVTYYRRLTRDHTHFSPGLYWGLNRKIAESSKLKAESSLIIHIHTWWNLVSVVSCLIGVWKKAPMVLSPRGTLSSYSFGNKNNFIKNVIFKLSKPLLNRCHFHVTSENEKKAILGLVRPKGIWVIPNLVSLPEGLKVGGCGLWEEKQEARDERQESRDKNQEARDKKQEARDKKQESGDERQEGRIMSQEARQESFKLLFLSRIEEKKGLELLFSALKDIDLNYHLSIAGSGDEGYVERLKHLAKTLGIENKISWMGQQSAEQKFDVMEAHDLLVLPSYDENFANVVIESLAMGTAVLVTENVGLSDYVKEEDLGWVCKFDREDLKHSLILAAGDLMKLERIREIAPEKIREDFSDERLVKRYIEMYRSILAEDEKISTASR